MKKEFLKDHEAAAVLADAGLGVSPRTLWRWAEKGKPLAPVRIGGCTRWRASDLCALVNGTSKSEVQA